MRRSTYRREPPVDQNAGGGVSLAAGAHRNEGEPDYGRPWGGRDLATRHMTQDQISDAERLALEWKPPPRP